MDRWPSPRSLKCLLWLAAGMPFFTAPCQAAVITGSYTGDVGNVTYDLTTLGTSDWAVWDRRTATTTTNGAPVNSMSGAVVISDIFAVSGPSLRGTTANFPPYNFSFTNGTSPASGTVTDAAGMFNSTLNTTGVGIGLTFELPTVETYTVRLWVSGFGASGTFTASMPGATTYTDTSFSATSIRIGSLYTLTVTPDNAGDVLTINFTGAPNGTGNGHTIISAAAISVIPEPSAPLLSLGAASLLVLSRRRRFRPG